MRQYLLLALFIFISTHAAQAQCNPRQYNQIFNEAENLRKRGQFIEAKNKFAASKIYACNDKEQFSADEAIDSLFGQIDLLRRSENAFREKAELEAKKYQAMRDTAIQERQRAEVLIEAFKLKQEGDIAFQSKNINKANDYYQQSILKLDYFTNLSQSSVERTLKSQLEEKIAEVDRLSDIYKQHQKLIEEGDQFAKNKKLFIQSYKSYIKAWGLGVDSKQALDRLKDLELVFNQNSKMIRRLKGKSYYDLLNSSAEANLILGNPAGAFKRINNILKYRPNDLDLIENYTLKQYVLTSKRNKKRNTECYLASGGYLNAKARSGWSPGYSFGIKAKFGSNFFLGMEVFYRNFDSNNEESKSLDQLELPIFGEYSFYKAPNKKWLSNCFDARAVAGFSLGGTSYNISAYKFPDIAQPSILKGRISEDTLVSANLYYTAIKYQSRGDSVLEYFADPHTGPLSRYLNLFIGLNLNYIPFPKYPLFSLNATISYNFQTSSNKGNSYPIKEPFLTYLNSKYGLTSAELTELKLKFDEANVPENLVIDGFSPEVFSRMNIKFGFLFRF